MLSLLSSTLLVGASPNADKFACDETRLLEENKCFFVSTEGVDLVEHEVDIGVAQDGYRQVIDKTGRQLTVSPLPWTDGDKLVASTELLNVELSNYATAFELIAPLRDAVMFHSDLLAADKTWWDQLTKVFVDCKIKQETEHLMTDHGMEMEVSMTEIWEVIGDASAAGTNLEGVANAKNYLLQFLEEGAIDLVCLMTDVEQERCEHIRSVSTTWHDDGPHCWDAAWDGLYAAPDLVNRLEAAEAPMQVASTTMPDRFYCVDDRFHTKESGDQFWEGDRPLFNDAGEKNLHFWVTIWNIPSSEQSKFWGYCQQCGREFQEKGYICGGWSCKWHWSTITLHRDGRPCGSCAPKPGDVKLTGRWVKIGSSTDGSDLTITEGNSRSMSHTEASEWSNTVTQSASAGIEVEGIGGSISIGSSTSMSLAQSHTSSFSKSTSTSWSWTAPPGVVWQWEFDVDDKCGKATVTTPDVVVTPAVTSPPCCLPGFFADASNALGECTTVESALCKPANACDTDGTWYLPLDMAGQERTESSWEDCQKRCQATAGCQYFNAFPNGGCHITTGAEGTKPGGDNPTKRSGKKHCYEWSG